MEDDPSQNSSEHEVRTCIDNADPDCATGKRESTCK